MGKGWIVLLCLLLTGCGASVVTLYEQERLAALSDPGPPPAQWTANGAIAVSSPLIKLLATATLGEQLESKASDLAISLPGAKVTPSLQLKSLAVKNSECADCVLIETGLNGDLKWRLLTQSGNSSFTVKATIQLGVNVVEKKDGWHISLRPEKVVSLRVSTEKSHRLLDSAIATPLETWLSQILIDLIPPTEIATLPASGLSPRAVEVTTEDSSLLVNLLLPGAQTAPLPPAKIRNGWSATLSSDAISELVREQSFRNGPDDHEVVVTPSSLVVDKQQFILSIRVWRLINRGWWRDYKISGSLATTNKRIKLTATDVSEVGQSAGASFVDPLATLGESLIIKAIEDAINTSIPAMHSQALGKNQLRMTVQNTRGSGPFVVVSGIAKLK